MQRGEYGRPAAIVIGAGEIGSAVAVVLHRVGCAVVLTDEVDPAWPRRGMAFTNAWYIGNAELDGEAAVFCASLKSIPAVLDRHRAVAATSWSWAGIARSFQPAIIVDASLRSPGGGMLAADCHAGAVLTIGLKTNGSPEVGFDVAVECPPDEYSGDAGNAVAAAHNGRFSTSRRIGDRVAAGEVVGGIGSHAVVAPCDGALRGLAARGARVQRGARIVEVDPRGDPVLCFGLDERAAAIAREVLRAATEHGALPADAVTPA